MLGRTPSSFIDRRTQRPQLSSRWTIDRWTRRAYLARRRALVRIRSTARRARCPQAPAAARAARRRAFATAAGSRSALRRIYPGHVPPRFARARRRPARPTLRLWQLRSAAAALAVVAARLRVTPLPGLAPPGVPLHPPLRGRLEREHRQRLLRRPADGRRRSSAATAPTSRAAGARPTTGRSGRSSRPPPAPTAPAVASGRGRTPPASAA